MGAIKATEREKRLLQWMPIDLMNELVDVLHRHAWLEARIGSREHKHWLLLVELGFLEAMPLAEDSPLVHSIEVFGAGERYQELPEILKELNLW